MSGLTELLDIAIAAALSAAEQIMKVYSKPDFNIELKGDNSPLTEADRLAHHKIEEHLGKTGIPVLSEEGKQIPYDERKHWERLWIVDPLDGTKEFIKRNGDFTVNIALVENGEPVLGVVYGPDNKELYYASQEIGTFYVCALSGSDVQKLKQEAEKLPNTKNAIYTIVASRSHLSKETKEYIEKAEERYGQVETVSRGSSLKLCMVATGEADLYPRIAPTMEWDTAAGHAIAKFSGATVNEFQKKTELRYNKENLLNPFFVVSR